MPTVLITPENLRDDSSPHVDMLCEAGFEVRYPKDPHFTRGLCSEEDTIEAIRGVDALIAGGEVLTERVLSGLPELRVIARAGVGYDRVDIAAATNRSIAVTITPTANHAAVAEHALALLFAVKKDIVNNDAHTRAGRWNRDLTKPVRGLTMGIFGLGRIGRSMAVRSIALGMTVIATEMYPDERFVGAHNIELVDFQTLLARSDVISIHCPLSDETRGIFNRGSFAKMKPGSVMINTARGEIVVETDLLDALKNGPLSAAGLDVFEVEPVTPDNPLFALDNVVVTPHNAGNDERASQDMGIEAAECIIKLHRGQWPDGAVVNDELKGRWTW